MRIILPKSSPFLLALVATNLIPANWKGQSSVASAFVTPVPPRIPAKETFLGPGWPALLPHYGQTSTRTTNLFGIFSDLDKLGDYDPENDKDGKKALELVDLTIQVLEALDSGGVKTKDLSHEVFSKDQVEAEASVSRRQVTQNTPNFGERIPAREVTGPVAAVVVKNEAASNIQEDEMEKRRQSSFGEILGLLKELKLVFNKSEFNYTTYPKHAEFPNYDLSKMMKMLDGPPTLEYFFSAKKTVRLLRRILRVAVGLSMTEGDVDKAKTAEEKFAAMFTQKNGIMGFLFPFLDDLVPVPEHTVKNWQSDKEVARQFLCGTNPLMINVVKDIDTVSRQLVNFFGKDKLTKLSDEQRLFYVSYDDLAELNVLPHQAYPLPMNRVPQDEPRYFHAPMALFILDSRKKELDVLGIQLSRTPDAEVHTAQTSSSATWLYAKSCLTTADSQMHEWVSHLGRTHLTMEPHILAIHNTLKKHNHPLHTFLKPLCKDTLLLNWAARRTLANYDDNSFGDYMTSVGVGQFMQLIEKYWSKYDFFKTSGFKAELESRGFDESFDMPSYLYREDGSKIWEAYGEFAKDFVNEIFDSDEEVKNDRIIQEWAKETSDHGRAAVKGFPARIDNKDTLVKILQILAWTASGLHAAVNFPQYDFYAYAPNKPLGMREHWFPEGLNGSRRKWIFEESMPYLEKAKETIQVTTSLTLPSEHCIDRLHKDFSDVGNHSYRKFVKQLDKISREIETRNKENKRKKKAVYSYLNPSVVPASIDI